MAEKKANAAKKEVKQVDKQAFVKRKLGILNQKTGAKYERNAVRVVENNK